MCIRDRLYTYTARLDSAGLHDKGDVGCLFPDSSFAPVLLFAEVPPVIGPEDDDRVPCRRAFLKGVEDAPDEGVSEGDAGEIMLVRGGPTTRLSNPTNITRFFFGELAPGAGNVIEVFRDIFRDFDLIQRVEVEVFLWGVPW